MGEPSPLVCCYPGQTKTFPPFSFVNSCGDGALTAHSTAGGNTAAHMGVGGVGESQVPLKTATSLLHLPAQSLILASGYTRPQSLGSLSLDGPSGPETQRRPSPSQHLTQALDSATSPSLGL